MTKIYIKFIIAIYLMCSRRILQLVSGLKLDFLHNFHTHVPDHTEMSHMSPLFRKFISSRQDHHSIWKPLFHAPLLGYIYSH